MNVVQLNHIYVVIDKKTYELIKNSDLISSFASTYEQKNFADKQVGWEGFYIRGKNTFIELFYPQERYPTIGISGIGMGVDTKGALNNILERMKNEHSDVKKGNFSRNGKLWFEYLAVNDSYFYERNSFWIMEYASECFSENFKDISRAHYNAEKYDPKKPLLDVKGFSIALKPEGMAILSSYLKSSGLFEQDHSYITSENVIIKLSEEDEHHKGIFQINFSLNNHFKESRSYHLGNSKLTFDGQNGFWTFLQK